MSGRLLVALALDPRWAALAPGLLDQAGIAEETLFRGYLFRRVRRGRRFWPSVLARPEPGVRSILVAALLFFDPPERWPRMNARFGAGYALLVALVAPSAASAYPIFDVTASEVLSVDPPRVKTTFTIVETGYVPDGWCPWSWFDVTPLNADAPDAVQIFACEAPTGGQCDLVDYGGVPRATYSPHLSDGGTLPANTYTITTDRAAPCVQVYFYCITLMGGVPPLETCMRVDMPVPTNETSWGAVKSIYR